MEKTVFHTLETGGVVGTSPFDYVAVNGDQVEISIGYYKQKFNLQTAEQIIDILGGYCEDSRRTRADYYSEIDRLNGDIAARNTMEQGNGI